VRERAPRKEFECLRESNSSRAVGGVPTDGGAPPPVGEARGGAKEEASVIAHLVGRRLLTILRLHERGRLRLGSGLLLRFR
jgi:hypothetical protein